MYTGTFEPKCTLFSLFFIEDFYDGMEEMRESYGDNIAFLYGAVHVLLSRFYPDFLKTHFIQIQWNLDLRKILGVTKIFLKSRFFLISNTGKPMKVNINALYLMLLTNFVEIFI